MQYDRGFASPAWCVVASLMALLPAVFGGNWLGILSALLAVCMFLQTLSFIMHQQAELEYQMDLSQKQQHELALSEEKYRLLAENADVVVMSFDLDSHQVEVTDNYYKYFPKDISYQLPIDFPFFHPEERDGLVARIDAMSPPRNWDEKLRLRVKSGEYRWFRLIARELLDQSGRPIRVLCRLNNIDAQERHIERLRLRAQTDGMTGLYTKDATEQLVCRALEQMEDGLAALVLLDMDNLKQINDTYGHIEGDRAINIVAHVLRNRFRETDIVGRVGGDEFMLFLSGLKSTEWGQGIVEVLMEKLSGLRIGPKEEIPLTVSVGVSFAKGNDVSFEQLYREADEDMYRRKRRRKCSAANGSEQSA